MSQRECADCSWEEPVNLTMLNSAAADAGPSLSTDGRLLFFHSGRPGGFGGLDIWMSHRSDPTDDFGWEDPVNLGPDVNTAGGELMPEYVHQADYYLERGGHVPPNSAALYFGRGTGTNPGNNQDIYTVAMTRDGQTLGPAVLVDELRSDANDAAPSVSTNQKEDLLLVRSVRPDRRHLCRDPPECPSAVVRAGEPRTAHQYVVCRAAAAAVARRPDAAVRLQSTGQRREPHDGAERRPLDVDAHAGLPLNRRILTVGSLGKRKGLAAPASANPFPTDLR